ncbi:RNA polymerase sigma-70 factor (ECF subfamily) [Inquilinus ginsengisoli]|uniref:RNA polymerase sigma-70 factor (ECF subfamily) n=1 Tax=Inquilinus ginsengisoli TaxID=363840 RepID=A0ABU1JIS1_9PROT|nr:RNA polymerase sigma factor [Inquilinus ginsengisoli]MDR6288493.1 RNA polymerase sigma-70 factor (ECF subfamily) [Inquilinus ginsengisoli]
MSDPAERVKGALLTSLPRLRAFTRALAGSTPEGDDLLQATCERALERAHQAGATGTMQGWIFRIAYHLHLDRLRAGRRRGETADPVDPDTLPGGDAEAEVEATLMLASVQRAIDRLPEEQRSVLLLVSAGGLSHAAAAEALEVPVGTVMSRLHRGRQALHHLLSRRLVGATAVAAPRGWRRP